LIARSTSIPTCPISSMSHARWSVPTAWWWVIVGAHDAGDLLDRRTRIGSVPDDRAKSEEAADRVLTLAKATIR
jgi:hypothetical protein